MSEKDASFLYGLSKMTNPSETKDHKKNKQITNIAEFLELISRVAWHKFKEPDQSLADKTLLVLKDILALVGVKAVSPKAGGDDDESESDEDY